MLFIRSAELDGHKVNLRLTHGHIEAIGDKLEPRPGDTIFEATGGAVVPGLQDHHVHLRASAAAMLSVKCGPPHVHDLKDLSKALHDAPGSGWLRGVNYQESGDLLIDRAWLDRNAPDRPIRIQHRSGRLWVLNSAAIAALKIAVPKDGHLIDRDEELRVALSDGAPDLGPLSQILLQRGVTGVTDTTVRNEETDLRAFSEAGLAQHIYVMGRHMPDCADDLLPMLGPVKFHYHDHDLPSLADFADGIVRAHEEGRGAAIHCVTRAELFLALAALKEAGPLATDRIEHAALAPNEAIDMIARLGVTVVSQPHFLAEKAQIYRRDVAPDDQPLLYRLASFRRRDVPLAAGSDGPFGGLNPWRSMAAAVARPPGFGVDEALSPEEALALYTGRADAPGTARTVAVGEVADLCILDRPWEKARTDLADVIIKTTIVGGKALYTDDDA